MSERGLVSRVTPVQTAKRNCTRDEGGPFEFGNQVLISSHRKLLWSKAMVVSVAEKSGHDPVPPPHLHGHLPFNRVNIERRRFGTARKRIILALEDPANSPRATSRRVSTGSVMPTV
jgi:hypothetical protein